MTDSAERHKYTTGGDKRLLHRRWIGAGSNGHVHEIYDIPTGKTFARKLLHIPGPDQRDIDNEVRAIMTLCRKGHKNIVAVLKYGELPNSAYYFIDMELCDLNLAVYIHRAEPPNPSESLPYFIKAAPSDLRAVQIWNIMRQVAGGIKYIHGHDLVHRDVKPANVLYSRKDSVWKLADFGITSEGTARRARTTTGGRGTPGYRAPELMSDTAKGVYNNKVDIWSMGCILYELAVGTKVFNSDWAVIQHQLAGKDLEVNLNDAFGDQCGEELSGNINRMLRIDPQVRPTAGGLFDTFTRFCRSVDEGEVERLGEAHIGLSLQEKEADADAERRRIDAIIKAWKDAGIDILNERYQDGKTALHEAAEKGNLHKIKALKKLGLDFRLARDNFGSTPIFSAAIYGHVEAIRLLNELGVDLSAKDSNGSGAVHYAASWGQVDAINVLQDLGADISLKDAVGVTPMHYAALDGQPASLSTLKDLGADVSVRSNRGDTPMHSAALRGQVRAVRRLKELGADVSGKADNGTTPLHLAARFGQVEAIRELKKLGASFSETCNDGCTAIHYAATFGEAKSIKELKKLGADLFQPTSGMGRYTPIHLAAGDGRLDCIETLVELGADPYVKNAAGQTPCDVARLYKQTVATNLLLALADGKRGVTPTLQSQNRGRPPAGSVAGIEAFQQQMMPQSAREGGFSSTGLTGSANVPWPMTKDEKTVYDGLFRAWDAFGMGFIAGDTAIRVFSQTGLPRSDLQRIWDLADPGNKGQLDRDEFALALHLTYRRLNGFEIPDQLPPDAIPPT